MTLCDWVFVNGGMIDEIIRETREGPGSLGVGFEYLKGNSVGDLPMDWYWKSPDQRAQLGV